MTQPDQLHPLAAAFAGAAGLEPSALASAGAALDARLERICAQGRSAWPDLEVAPTRFAAHLGRLVGAVADPQAALSELATTDLYLACAALEGDPRTLTRFEDHTFGEIQAAAASLRASPADTEEVKQIVRTLLFVADGPRAASIGEYAGRGSLRGWVRVIATRELLRIRRKTRKEIPLEEYILDDLETHGDPEIERLKQVYRAQVGDALRDAIGQLEVRERLLLRYQICDHLTIDEIGAIYQVHRATAARWLGKARSALVDLTKERLAAVLSVDPSETDSILRLVQSQLDVSLERRLRDD